MNSRSGLNYGIIAVGFKRLADGTLVEALGSSGVRHFDQRWGLARMADEAHRWATLEGHAAYQLQRCHHGYRTCRPIGPIWQVTAHIQPERLP